MAIHVQFNDNLDLTITDQEIADIVADNLEDDVGGVQDDLMALAMSRNPNLYNLSIHVQSTNPFRCMVIQGVPSGD